MSNDTHDPNSVDAVLARMETKLDAALQKLEAHDSRIVSLERSRAWVLGAAAVVGVGIKAAWDWVRN